MKSALPEPEMFDMDAIGKSYYAFCIEQALANVRQARGLVKGDPVDDNHQLPTIERMLEISLTAI